MLLHEDKFRLIDDYGRHALQGAGSIVESEFAEIGHLADSLEAYARNGRPPDAFLRAVLENDLFGAVEKADERNQLVLPRLVKFIYQELPADCWGSTGKVQRWIDTEGDADKD